MKRIIATFRSGIAFALLVALVGTGCSKEDPERPEPAPTPEPSESTDADIDRWMFDYMKTHYLWNKAVKEVKPDYTLGYDVFLTDVLTKVSKQNDVNHDDGHWEDGKRSYFYSNIQRYKASAATAGVQTRGTRKQADGLGFEMIFAFYKDDKRSAIIFSVGAVTPNSPAAKKGLKRGDLIAKVGGVEIKESNWDKCWEKLMLTESGTVKVALYDINTDKTGSDISITAASYDDNPVWLRKTLTTDNGVKVGYLCYMSFNAGFEDPNDPKSTPLYDLALIEAFQKFREEKIDELVLDLRYNGGGHVVSSAVLATLITGDAYKGKVYTRMTYNADRSRKTPDVYKLGVAQYNAANSQARHNEIETALASALGLQRVYVLCTGNTASASELVVNGLRGLDFDVRLIGSTTNGKNVGMEPLEKTFGDYTYDFSPITFYIENAKGFRDYGNGFNPDVEAEELPFYFIEVGKSLEYRPLEWGDAEHDDLLFYAMQWIETGSKPVPATAKKAATRAFDGLQLRVPRPVRVQNMVLLPAPEE